MKCDDVHTYENLKAYQRGFTTFAGDPVPHDFNGAFDLLLAILDNLAENHIDADVEDLCEDGPCFTEQQFRMLKKLMGK